MDDSGNMVQTGGQGNPILALVIIRIKISFRHDTLGTPAHFVSQTKILKQKVHVPLS